MRYAAPMFDQRGVVVVAMLVGAPVPRVSRAQRPQLGAAIATARRISQALGYTAHGEYRLRNGRTLR